MVMYDEMCKALWVVWKGEGLQSQNIMAASGILFYKPELELGRMLPSARDGGTYLHPALGRWRQKDYTVRLHKTVSKMS